MGRKVLFWNFNVNEGRLMKQEPDKAAVLARLVNSCNADIFIVVDCKLPSVEILRVLKDVGPGFTGPATPHEKVRFFARSSGIFLDLITSDDRLVVCRLREGGREDILIGAIHFYGRRHKPLPESRHAMVWDHYQTLIQAEHNVNHSRTLLVGDFNMSPFEMGMVDPKNAFGALMTWELAEIHSSTETGAGPRFYNPMWSLMGRSGAPGTYYWKDSDPYNTYWYCLDGVLVRPSLRGVFLDESLSILTQIPGLDGQNIPLVRPPTDTHWHIEYSDHLPILFELETRELNSEINDG